MIYFIQQEVTNAIKIGVTNGDLNNRIKTLQVASPYKLKLLGIIEGDTKEETALKNLFSQYRLEGEWFKPDVKVIAHVEFLISNEIFKEKPSLKGLDNLDKYLERLEISLIKEALKAAEGSKTKAAKLLGIEFRSLRHRTNNKYKKHFPEF